MTVLSQPCKEPISLNDGEFYLADAIGVIDEILSGGGEFRMYPKGTSMLPLIVQGRDSVVLGRRKGIPVQKHDIAFYRRKNGQFVLHRVMKVTKDGRYVMCGDNQTALEKGIEAEQIIACVDRIYKGEKELRLNSLRYRLYVFFWTNLVFRRGIRFLQRVCRKVKFLFVKKKKK